LAIPGLRGFHIIPDFDVQHLHPHIRISRRSIYNAPFGCFLGDVRGEFVERNFSALHGTLDLCIRDALHEGFAAFVACIHDLRTSY
jgi:hypothetical protein